MAKATDRRRPKRGAAPAAGGKPKRRKTLDDLPEDGSKDEFFVDEAAEPGGTDSEPEADAEESETAEAKRLRLGAVACLVSSANGCVCWKGECSVETLLCWNSRQPRLANSEAVVKGCWGVSQKLLPGAQPRHTYSSCGRRGRRTAATSVVRVPHLQPFRLPQLATS